MQISTNEFLLGSVADLMAQESNLNQLNTQIATGQTMPGAASDPAGAGEALGLASGINHLTYDASNAQSAAQQLQSGLGVLQQVSALLDQLRQAPFVGVAGRTLTVGSNPFGVLAAQVFVNLLL